MLTRWTSFKIRVWNWCVNSGTIVWARAQYIVGLVFAGLLAAFSTYDWSSLVALDTKTIFKMLMFSAISGIVTELVRRKGTRVETVVVANEATNYEPVEVKRLQRVEPEPPPQG